ncbi:MAG: peptidase S10 [Roseiflexaceae bacterium]
MSTPPTPPAVSAPTPSDRLITSQHTVTVAGRQLSYTATTGYIILKEESEKKHEGGGFPPGEQPRAQIFFTAYTLNDQPNLAERPITFAFNGGPGSASVWLHLGLLGPRRVLFDDNGMPLPPPYRLVENDQTLLDLTDLVFIDPVSTGYSRSIPGEPAATFHGFKKDIESVGDFIRLYTTRYGRWASPKYLAGESYGTTRAAGLSGYLQQRHGMYLNGLILISAVLNFQTLEFDDGNDLPYILFLPTYAATAWYHQRLRAEYQRRSLRELLDEVEAFALGEYASALIRGTTLANNERARIARRIAGYTGLSVDYVERSHLRIRDMRFFKQLLHGDGRTAGRLDSRYAAIEPDSLSQEFFDPSMAAIMGPYTACLYQYIRGDLGFESDLPYEIISERVYPWSYAQHENKYVNVAETLRHAMLINPHLRVYVASGYYDLATPHFATDYTFNHLNLTPAQRQQVQISYFEAGHMMYIHQPSLLRLRQDLACFLNNIP